MEPPHEVRAFVHKRIIGAVTGFVAGGPLGAASGFVRGGSTRSGGQPAAPSVVRAPVSSLTRQKRARRARALRLGVKPGSLSLQATSCKPPLVRDVDGQCRFPGSPADISVGGAMAPEAIMGRYGAALRPMGEHILHLECLPGMVLGKDELCYNKGDLKNAERKWPRGRRPLGTPGEMAALAKAASFGRRMENTVKRMQKLGVLSKPRRATRPRPQPRLLGPGSPSIINVE